MCSLDDLSLGRKLVLIITGISGTALLVACLMVVSYDIHRFRVNQIEQQPGGIRPSSVTEAFLTSPEFVNSGGTVVQG